MKSKLTAIGETSSNGKPNKNPVPLSYLSSWLPGITTNAVSAAHKADATSGGSSGSCANDNSETAPKCTEKKPSACEKTEQKSDELDFNTMNLEEYAELFPEQSLNSKDRPTFWPHGDEDQLTAEDEDRLKRGSSHH